MGVDWTKPIQTGLGEPARLLFTHCMSITTNFPRVCVISEGTEKERICSFQDNGWHDARCGSPHGIVNVPEPKVVCVLNVYPTGCGQHETRQSADNWNKATRTHIVTITRIGDEVTATVEKV